MLLSKGNFNEIVKRRSKVVECPEFDVKIQSLLIEDQLQIEKLSNEKQEDNQLVFLMLKLSCIDDDNNLVLDDENVKKLPSDVALKLFDECLKLNGLGGNEIEQRAKNS